MNVQIHIPIFQRTGAPLSGRKRVQMNIELRKFDDFDLLNNVSEGIFPILWIEEGADISDEVLQVLKSQFSKIDLVNILKWAMIVAGLILLAVAFVMVLHREKMLCFGQQAEIKIAPVQRPVQERQSVGELQFNTTVMYPSLYPQMENRNIHDNMSNRNNKQQMPPVWNIKM